MSEEETETPTVDLRVAYADGGSAFMTQEMHGGPSSWVSMNFRFNAETGAIQLIFGNIPSFEDDAEKQVAAMKDVVSILSEVLDDGALAESIQADLDRQAAEDDDDDADEEGECECNSEPEEEVNLAQELGVDPEELTDVEQ